MADMAELIAQAKADAASLYGQAAENTRAQAAQIEQSYAQAAAVGVNDAAQRRTSDQGYLDKTSGEQRKAALAQGLTVGENVDDGTESMSGLYGAKYGADADAWKTFFDTTKGTALGRNESTAGSFENANNVQQVQYDKALAEAIASAYGGGGGGRGGGGGGGYDDEPEWVAPELGDMTDGLVKGLVASQRRYEGQAKYFQETGKSANTGTPGKAKAKPRKGGGGSF